MTLRAARLRELFDYDPETGAFVRRVTTAPNARAGDVAGTVNRAGYVVFNVDRKVYYAHRLAWLYMMGAWPEKGRDLDHINGDKADNRWSNLRLASRSQNNMNRSRKGSGTSGHRGVYRASPRADGKPWRAAIGRNGRQVSLGYFETFDEAVAARLKAERLHHGEFGGRD